MESFPAVRKQKKKYLQKVRSHAVFGHVIRRVSRDPLVCPTRVSRPAVWEWLQSVLQSVRPRWTWWSRRFCVNAPWGFQAQMCVSSTATTPTTTSLTVTMATTAPLLRQQLQSDDTTSRKNLHALSVWLLQTFVFFLFFFFCLWSHGSVLFI